jgi:hypothetical protein
MSGWGQRLIAGRDRGVAFQLCRGVPVAQVVEITANDVLERRACSGKRSADVAVRLSHLSGKVAQGHELALRVVRDLTCHMHLTRSRANRHLSIDLGFEEFFGIDQLNGHGDLE